MAFRGRGRGRGFGRGRGRGGDYYHGKPEPYVLFPEDVQFPTFPTKIADRDALLVQKKKLLEDFWKASCYNLEDASKKSDDYDREIQRFTDRFKLNMKRKRENVTSYLKLIPSNFPSELIQGSKGSQSSQKKLRWDKDVENKRWDNLEKLESSGKSKNDGEKEKKGDDDDGDEQLLEEDEESSDDGDYNQNRDFDDDEDDLNMEEEPDEDTYE